jgi:hypothetical protein
MRVINNLMYGIILIALAMGGTITYKLINDFDVLGVLVLIPLVVCAIFAYTLIEKKEK